MSDCCAQLIYTKRSNWRSNWRSPEEWDPWYYLFRYILYTDIDVIFTGDITLDTFGVPLPKYFTMGAETHGDRVSTAAGIVLGQGRSYKCGNAGVMLLNTRNMRRAHSEFTAWTFSETNVGIAGLHFGMFGPGDQGALNMFFHEYLDVRAWPLFNWKPYWGNEAAHGPISLVHFHGPKPDEYSHFHQSMLLANTTSETKGPGATNVINTTNAIHVLLKQCEIHGNDCWRFVELFVAYCEKLTIGDETYRPQLAKSTQIPNGVLPSTPIDRASSAQTHRGSSRSAALRNIRRPPARPPPKPTTRKTKEALSEYYSNRDALSAALRDVEAAWKRIDPSRTQQKRPRLAKSEVKPRSLPRAAPWSARSTVVNIKH